MDSKGDHRWKLEDLWRQHHDTTSSRSPVATFFRKHKQSLFTGMLLCILLVLLCGIFSQVPAPSTGNPPDGVTVVNYSTFVQQVKARNMLTVTMQGDVLTGVMAHPLALPVSYAESPSRERDVFKPHDGRATHADGKKSCSSL